MLSKLWLSELHYFLPFTIYDCLEPKPIRHSGWWLIATAFASQAEKTDLIHEGNTKVCTLWGFSFFHIELYSLGLNAAGINIGF